MQNNYKEKQNDHYQIWKWYKKSPQWPEKDENMSAVGLCVFKFRCLNAEACTLLWHVEKSKA